VKLRIYYPTDLLVPVKAGVAYFDDDNGSQIFSMEDIGFADNGLLDGHVLTYEISKHRDIGFGYNSSPNYPYKNRLVKVTFTALSEITDIYQYFQPSDNLAAADRMFLLLLDVNYNKLPYSFIHLEKIHIRWEMEYRHPVGTILPPLTEFNEDILILNRNNGEYSILLNKDNIDVNKTGAQALGAVITDLISGDVIYMVKMVDVVDEIAPTISGADLLNFDDNLLSSCNFLSDITVNDNYSKNIVPTITYLESDNTTIIPSSEAFRNYLFTHQLAYLKIDAQDESGNGAEPIYRQIMVKDKTAPSVTQAEDIVLENDEVKGFQFEEKVLVSDSYDATPMLIFSFKNMNGEDVDDYLELLEQGQSVIICYFAQDASFNQSATFETKIEVLDTIKPTITAPSETAINDTMINVFNPESEVTATDNFAMANQLTMTYFLADQLTSVNEIQFRINLESGNIGYIKYEISDNFGNLSEPVFRKIIPLDTTGPTITIANITPNEKYFSIDRIDYDVRDSFDAGPVVNVTLDGQAYNQEIIDKIGIHRLVITAVDEAGNETEKVIEFEIIAKKIFACGDDVSCYVTYYYEYLIGGSIIIILIIYSIVYFVNRKKGSKTKPTIY
jgi:hypothetical protein